MTIDHSHTKTLILAALTAAGGTSTWTEIANFVKENSTNELYGYDPLKPLAKPVRSYMLEIRRGMLELMNDEIIARVGSPALDTFRATGKCVMVKPTVPANPEHLTGAQVNELLEKIKNSKEPLALKVRTLMALYMRLTNEDELGNKKGLMRIVLITEILATAELVK